MDAIDGHNAVAAVVQFYTQALGQKQDVIMQQKEQLARQEEMMLKMPTFTVTALLMSRLLEWKEWRLGRDHVRNLNPEEAALIKAIDEYRQLERTVESMAPAVGDSRRRPIHSADGG